MNHIILLSSVAVPSLLVIGCLLLWRLWRRRDGRRSPLTVKLLNLPGENLRKRIEKHGDGFMESAAMLVALGPVCLSAWLLVRFKQAGVEWSRVQFGSGDAILFGTFLCLLGWTAWRLIHHARLRMRCTDGLKAEIAVAQSLTPLIAEGAMVFHDFPADQGNIDHIVIGSGAVFAIETKSRRKPAMRGKQSARVEYDGTRLKFPGGREERTPLEQAAWQADWLDRFLDGGVGEKVRVIPVLALPGWYVARVPSDLRARVIVSNCTNPAFLMDYKFGPPISEPLRRRVAHVLTQRYHRPEVID